MSDTDHDTEPFIIHQEQCMLPLPVPEGTSFNTKIAPKAAEWTSTVIESCPSASRLEFQKKLKRAKNRRKRAGRSFRKATQALDRLLEEATQMSETEDELMREHSIADDESFADEPCQVELELDGPIAEAILQYELMDAAESKIGDDPTIPDEPTIQAEPIVAAFIPGIWRNVLALFLLVTATLALLWAMAMAA